MMKILMKVSKQTAFAGDVPKLSRELEAGKFPGSLVGSKNCDLQSD